MSAVKTGVGAAAEAVGVGVLESEDGFGPPLDLYVDA
jgi:hypothetical protein